MISKMLELFYNFGGYNKEIFIFINNLTNISFLPLILKAISSVFFIANFAAIYLIVCIYFYFKIKKSPNPAKTFEPIYYELVRIGACYAFFGITFSILKFSVNFPRPFCSLTPIDFTTIIDISLERCLSSFPSAHTGLAILAAYCLWPYMNRALKFTSCAIIFAVAISRMTLAMHYPADILYSAIVTLVVIIFSNYLFCVLKKPLIIPVKNWITPLIFK
jgi:membrane-associated phospholipid phosphatase